MSTTTISTDHDVVTLINVFTVTRETQHQLVDLLIGATEEAMRHRPGFVSANIHASLDGTRVVNYAVAHRGGLPGHAGRPHRTRTRERRR